MPLADKEIKQLCEEGMVVPFDSTLVNPCSLDIRIGFTLKLMKKKPLYGLFNLLKWFGKREAIAPMLKKQVEWVDVPLHYYSEEKPFWLFHGDKILVASLETFNFPDNICAQFRLKSSRGREFYEHLEAGFADNGWHNSKLTMEIECRNYAPLPIYPGLKMGQFIFERTELPDASYKITGRYNNDNAVQESRG